MRPARWSLGGLLSPAKSAVAQKLVQSAQSWVITIHRTSIVASVDGTSSQNYFNNIIIQTYIYIYTHTCLNTTESYLPGVLQITSRAKCVGGRRGVAFIIVVYILVAFLYLGVCNLGLHLRLAPHHLHHHHHLFRRTHPHRPRWLHQ